MTNDIIVGQRPTQTHHTTVPQPQLHRMQDILPLTMTAFYHLVPLLAMASVASGYQIPHHRTPKFGTAATHSRLKQKQEDDGIIVVHSPPPSSVRPILLTASVTTAAALFTYISVMPSNAADSFETNSVSVIHPEAMKDALLSKSYQHSNTVKSFTSITPSSSLQLSRSTLVNPIGELKDGSENSAAISFGQWFFVVYIVVSLVAGGNEMMRRIQKQMDDNT